MRFLTTFFASTACLALLAEPIAATELRRAPSIFDVIALWLETTYGVEVNAPHPDIRAMPADQLVRLRYGDGAAVGARQVMALYDVQSGAILVPEDWTGQSLADLSVLVHEMVHHIQEASGVVFACPAAREELAYRAQNDWLQLFGEDLESAFNIDPAMILVATACVH